MASEMTGKKKLVISVVLVAAIGGEALTYYFSDSAKLARQADNDLSELATLLDDRLQRSVDVIANKPHSANCEAFREADKNLLKVAGKLENYADSLMAKGSEKIRNNAEDMKESLTHLKEKGSLETRAAQMCGGPSVEI